jgi:hypothetical protein
MKKTRTGVLWVLFALAGGLPVACHDDDKPGDDGGGANAGEGGDAQKGGRGGSSGATTTGGRNTGGVAGGAGTRGGASGSSGRGGAGDTGGAAGTGGDGEPGGMAGDGGTSGGEGGLGGAGGAPQACSPHDLDSSIDVPTEVDAAPCEDVYLSDICPAYEFNNHFCLRFDSVYWQPNMVIDGVTYAHGLGMHPPEPPETIDASCRFFQTQTLQLDRAFAAWSLAGYDRFAATIGMAEENGQETTSGANGVRFRAYVDGTLRFESDMVDYTTPPTEVMVDTTGGSTLLLEVDSLGDNHADAAVWANARVRRTCPP